MQILTKVFGPQVAMFFTTTNNGVSISEIGRRQAEYKQLSDEFAAKLADGTNGVYRKKLSYIGAGNGTPLEVQVVRLTAEDLDGYKAAAKRDAETAVLMSGLKLWKTLQAELQKKDLRLYVADSLPPAPDYPVEIEPPTPPAGPKPATTCGTEAFMDLDNIDEMVTAMSAEVLTKFDFAFFTKARRLNSSAARIGKLISERGSFFRKLGQPLPQGSEQTLQGGMIVTSWERSYSPAEITAFAEYRVALQAEYDSLQKQLNGCKKEMKDAVRAYNAEQERQYQTAYTAYQSAHSDYLTAVKQQNMEYEQAYKAHAVEMERIRSSAETLRQQALAELANLRVRIAE